MSKKGQSATFISRIVIKKNLFSMQKRFDLYGYVNKPNCRIWVTENTHWKADTPKTGHCLVRILVQRYNWAIFLRKWARRSRCSQWRSLLGHVERCFVPKNCKGGYWQHLVSTGRRYVAHSRSYSRCFAPCFWRSHYQPQSWCRLTNLELPFDTVELLFVGCRQR